MRDLRSMGPRFAVVAAMLWLAACGGNAASSPSASLPIANAVGAQSTSEPPSNKGDRKIEHVVIIIQENRSFDNLFQGYPRADTHSYGYDSSGDKIRLGPVGLESTWDIEHDAVNFFQACNGRGSYPGTDCQMNGFNREQVSCITSCPDHPQYSYVPHSETKPYFDMAKQYVLADRMFASNFDASSFVSHQYIIAGQAMSAVNYPNGPWGCEGGSGDTVATVTQQRRIPGSYIRACFDDATLGEELDAAHLSWRFYASKISGSSGGIWSAYQANKHVFYGPDWEKDIATPPTAFFGDVAHGTLPVVSWVTPTWTNSDHAGSGSKTGPAWVASLVNAIGESKYWRSTAIFIFWDDYGGWYEHVPPKLVDYDGLGFRIPLLIVSAYAKRGYVSHVHYEHGSILRFVEDRFGLGRLSASDSRANSPEKDAFDFSQPPRNFRPIVSAHGKEYFLRQPSDYRAPDSE